MIDYQPLYETLQAAKAEAWVTQLQQQLHHAFDPAGHGHLAYWHAVLANIPQPASQHRKLNQDCIEIGQAHDLNPDELKRLEQQLKVFCPWRKGPFKLYGIHIDTEWRSDWKWQRLQDHIAPLKHRLVLDVGCGNGYHCWRMLGAGAKMAVGIDPTLLSVVQFQAVRKLYGEAPIYVLPLALEDLPAGIKAFDTVFSMGVLYHRRSPIDHLLALKDCLQPGGELVLETLVIDGGLGEVLMPEGRYAQMRNVWFLPSCDTLMLWLKRCGFINIRLLDVNTTSTAEQRSTAWMNFQSLKDFLLPSNPQLTLEGLPAPKRAIVIANNP
jgi:tRNA (mo5U34)-methyltransferase